MKKTSVKTVHNLIPAINSRRCHGWDLSLDCNVEICHKHPDSKLVVAIVLLGNYSGGSSGVIVSQLLRSTRGDVEAY